MGSRIRTSGTSRARVLLIGLCQLLLLSSARASTSPPHQWWLDQTYLTGAAPSFTVDQTGVIHATTYSTLPSPRNTYWRRDDNCHWGAFAFSPGNDPRPQGFNTSVAMGTDGQPYIAYVGHTTMSVNSSLQARIAHYAGTLTNPWTLDSLSLDAATEHQVNVRVSSSGKLHVTFVGGYYLEYATNVSGSWVTTVFSTTPGVSAGVDGHALALDSQGNVHIAYCYRTTTGPSAPTHLGYMKYDASTHVWTDTTLDANNNAGVGPGISIGPDGEPVISYNSLYNLQLMRHSSSGWVSSVVIAGNGSDSTANCVGSTAICHDSGGRAHVAAYFVAHGQPVMLYVRGDGAYGWSDTVTTVPGVGAGGAARFDMVGTSAGFAQFLAMAYEPGGGSGIQYIEGLPGPSDTTPPATITDLHVITGDRSACAMWTAPGDDGAVGQATNYDVRFSYSPITSFSFPSEQQLPSPCPGLAGASECVSDTGLAACSPVYFAVKTRDESGNWSAMSNLASGTLRCHGRFPIDVSCSNGYRAAPTSQGDDGVPGLWITSANPTRSGVTLEFETAFPTRQVRLCVFDAAGRRIRSLETRSSGPTGGRAAWDLSKASGGRARAGIYFVRMEAPGCRFTRAVVVTD